jgi:hypothetical protein
MLFNLIDLLTLPEQYVCVWRDGELYVEPVAATCAMNIESDTQLNRKLPTLLSGGSAVLALGGRSRSCDRWNTSHRHQRRIEWRRG